jgi:hypothetical protein
MIFAARTTVREPFSSAPRLIQTNAVCSAFSIAGAKAAEPGMRAGAAFDLKSRSVDTTCRTARSVHATTLIVPVTPADYRRITRRKGADQKREE